VSHHLHCSAVRAQSVCHNHTWLPIPFHKFLQENQRSLSVAAPGNKRFQNFSFMIDSAPQIICCTIDLYEDLIEMPSPVGMIPGRVKSFLPDLMGRCCQTNATSSPYGVKWHKGATDYATLSCCHSASAAFR